MFPGASMESSGSGTDSESCVGPFCLGQKGGMGGSMGIDIGGGMGGGSGGGSSTGCQGPFCISSGMMGGAGGGIMGGSAAGMMDGSGGVGGLCFLIFCWFGSLLSWRIFKMEVCILQIFSKLPIHKPGNHNTNHTSIDFLS